MLTYSYYIACPPAVRPVIIASKKSVGLCLLQLQLILFRTLTHIGYCECSVFRCCAQSLHMERVGKMICDSQSGYEDGARKQHILKKRRGAAAAMAADLTEVE